MAEKGVGKAKQREKKTAVMNERKKNECNNHANQKQKKIN